MEQPRINVMAEVMQEAMPYIQKYKNKTIVVKYGGNAMTSAELKDAVMSDLLLLNLLGVHVVLVHGGGPDISSGLKRIGKESKFIDGLRVTDKESMEVVQQVLAGKVNKDLVAMLKGQGIGLCGIDGSTLSCKKLAPVSAEKDLGYVGEITKVRTTMLRFALDSGFIPVVATIGVDDNGTAYNVNADTAASKIAIALGASKLVNMTDVAGLLMDKDDPSTLITNVEVGDIPALIEQGIISGGMIPKIECCVDSLSQGVGEAVIVDGRVPHSILLELFSKRGNGTLLYAAKDLK